MRKTLYLHIGTQKTGTTAIQDFLTKNLEQIKEYGVEYVDPRESLLGTDNHNHGHLGLSLNGYWRKTDYQLTGDEAWAELRKLFYYSKRSLVVSTELLSTPQILQHLAIPKKHLAGANVKIIIYLRRQDIFLQSVYEERIKAQEGRDFDRAFSEGDYKDIIKYRHILDVWAEHFGKDAIIVRPYEKKQLVGENVIKDFLGVLGIDEFDGFVFPDRVVNRTMNRYALELSKNLNSLGYKADNLLAFKWQLHDIFELEDITPFSAHNMIDAERQLAIMDSSKADNQFIAKEYMGRESGILFNDTEPTVDDTDYTNMPMKDVALLAKALHEIMVKKDSVNKKIG